MMTVTFYDRGGKTVGRGSFPFCPPVGAVIDLAACAGVVESVKFVDGPCGIEAQALLGGQPAKAGATQEAGEPKVQTGKQTKGK